MSRHRKTAIRRPSKRPRTYLRRRRPGEPRLRELRRLPWWTDALVQRILDDTRRDITMSIDVAFYGSVVRDAEAKTSKAGKAYARFTVRAGDGDGVQFISVMYFAGDVAEVAPKLVQGTKVYVEGSLKLDEWTGQDGAKRHGLSVMSFHVRIAEIGRHKPPRRSDDAAAPAARGDPHDDNMPFGPEWR